MGRTNFNNNSYGNALIYKVAEPLEIAVVEVSANNNPSIPDSVGKLLHMSELIDQNRFRLIQLQTTSASLLGEISKIIYNESGIFILDSKVTNKLAWFDNNGNFIRAFNLGFRLMKAPIDFDVSSNILSILDQESQLFTFKLNNKEANLVTHFKLPFVAGSLKIMDTANILFFNQSYDYEPYSFLTMNFIDTSITGREIPIKEDFITKFTERFTIWSSSNKNAFFCSVPNQDTIYKVEGNTISPFLNLSFGKLGLPIEAYDSEADYKRLIYKSRRRSAAYSFETSEYFTGSFAAGLIHWFVINKRTSSVKVFKSFGDDLTGNVFTHFPIAAYKDSFIQVGSAEVLAKRSIDFQNTPKKTSLQQALTNLIPKNNRRNNPLLLIYLPKNIK